MSLNMNQPEAVTTASSTKSFIANGGQKDEKDVFHHPEEIPTDSVPSDPLLQTKAAIVEEVRLAVVMYGGSSLSVYIHGVAQELFHLVRSTALDPEDSKQLYLRDTASTDPAGADREPAGSVDAREPIRGTESVYRRLGQCLGARKSDSGSTQPLVRTRFVIDVLSGTSAGGINSVFLAKALANNQDPGVLKQLWLEGGALEQLLNDKQTVDRVKDPWIPLAKPVTSLLSSRRIYRVIYEALRNMERSKPSAPDTKSPLPAAVVDMMLQTKAALRSTFLMLRTAVYDMTRPSPEGAETILQTLQALVKADERRSEREIPLLLTEETVKAEFNPLLQRIQDDIRSATEPTALALQQTLADNAPLKRCTQNYEVYDSVIFPALYNTGIGEMTKVDILRISPLDVENSTAPLEKLAGTKLGHFGALLQRPWR